MENTTFRKIALPLLIVILVVALGWLGYKIMNKPGAKNTAPTQEEIKAKTHEEVRKALDLKLEEVKPTDGGAANDALQKQPGEAIPAPAPIPAEQMNQSLQKKSDTPASRADSQSIMDSLQKQK